MNHILRLAFRFVRVLPALALGFAGPLYSADKPTSDPAPATAPATAPAAIALADPQKAAMDTLDGVIARYEVLVNRDDDAKHQAAAKIVLDTFQKRRDALRQTYDQGHYDDLRVDLTLEYQRLASWLAAPKTLPLTAPADHSSKPGATRPQGPAPK